MGLEKIKKQITEAQNSGKDDIFKESEVISLLVKYLKENGWKVKEQIRVEYGSIDVGAEKEGKILLVEAKGEDRGLGGTAEMNFQIGLGQLMSRMTHKEADYGLAFPLTTNFVRVLRKYHESFAFEKLGIYLIPVNRDGSSQLVPPTDALKFLENATKSKAH
jgi:hypothetical protein